MDWLLGWLHACVFVYEVVRHKQDGGNGEGLAETNGNSQKEDEEGGGKGMEQGSEQPQQIFRAETLLKLGGAGSQVRVLVIID